MTGDERRREQARHGLRAWSGFPADRQPRPLVLLGPAARPGGFPDAQKKMAFLRGAITAAPGFPEELLLALRGQPANFAGPPLQLITGTPGTAEFATDRGRQQLPAWRVRARDVPEPFWVLDPATSQLAWQPPDHDRTEWRGSTAELDADGRTLTLNFSGSPRAFTDYATAEVLESGAAIAMIPVPRELSTKTEWRATVAAGRQVTAVLAQPLGGRVLLDGWGSPVMVNALPPLAAAHQQRSTVSLKPCLQRELDAVPLPARAKAQPSAPGISIMTGRSGTASGSPLAGPPQARYRPNVERSEDRSLAQVDHHAIVDLIGDDGAFAQHRYSWWQRTGRRLPGGRSRWAFRRRGTGARPEGSGGCG